MNICQETGILALIMLFMEIFMRCHNPTFHSSFSLIFWIYFPVNFRPRFSIKMMKLKIRLRTSGIFIKNWLRRVKKLQHLKEIRLKWLRCVSFYSWKEYLLAFYITKELKDYIFSWPLIITISYLLDLRINYKSLIFFYVIVVSKLCGQLCKPQFQYISIWKWLKLLWILPAVCILEYTSIKVSEN